MPEIRAVLSFYWDCAMLAFDGAWGVAGGVGTVVSALIPLAIKMKWLPGKVETMNELMWQIPLGLFGVLFIGRLLLAPFWMYDAKSKEAMEAANQSLAASQVELHVEVEQDDEGEEHRTWDGRRTRIARLTIENRSSVLARNVRVVAEGPSAQVVREHRLRITGTREGDSPRERETRDIAPKGRIRVDVFAQEVVESGKSYGETFVTYALDVGGPAWEFKRFLELRIEADNCDSIRGKVSMGQNQYGAISAVDFMPDSPAK